MAASRASQESSSPRRTNSRNAPERDPPVCSALARLSPRCTRYRAPPQRRECATHEPPGGRQIDEWAHTYRRTTRSPRGAFLWCGRRASEVGRTATHRVPSGGARRGLLCVLGGFLRAGQRSLEGFAQNLRTYQFVVKIGRHLAFWAFLRFWGMPKGRPYPLGDSLRTGRTPAVCLALRESPNTPESQISPPDPAIYL